MERAIDQGPKIRRKTCPTCGVPLTQRPPVYAGRRTIVRAWDGNSVRNYDAWDCGFCEGMILQQVGR